MAVADTSPVLTEKVGGQDRRLLLRNSEIERFEAQYAPFGIYELLDQLFGRGPKPQARHVRDLIALGLIGGGMVDRAADDLVASLPPSENEALYKIAQALIGVTFWPAVLDEKPKKRAAGSRKGGAVQPSSVTTPETGSGASAG